MIVFNMTIMFVILIILLTTIVVNIKINRFSNGEKRFIFIEYEMLAEYGKWHTGMYLQSTKIE